MPGPRGAVVLQIHPVHCSWCGLAGTISFTILVNGVDDTFWNNLIARSAANLTNAVSILYADGERVIMVPNQVDLSRIPLVVDSGLPFLPQLQVYLRGKLEQFNGSLGAALTAIAQPTL